MRLVLLALGVAGALAFLALPYLATPLLLAQEQPWKVQRFHAEVTLKSDGNLSVSETIDVDFGESTRNSFVRSIPARFTYGPDYVRAYRIKVSSVTDVLGQKLPYNLDRSGTNFLIKVGSDGYSVSGLQTYIFTYTVAGALLPVLSPNESYDELTWLVGDLHWNAPVRILDAVAIVDSTSFHDVTCAQGVPPATERCTINLSEKSVAFAATRPLKSGEALSLSLRLPKGAVKNSGLILEDVDLVAAVWKRSWSSSPTALSLGLLVLLAGLYVVWRYWKSRRLAPVSTPSTENLASTNLRPLQLSVLLDGVVRDAAIGATLIDLSIRGFLTIEELSPHEWRFRRTEESTLGQLTSFEEILLGSLFEFHYTVTTEDLIASGYAPRVRLAILDCLNQSRPFFAYGLGSSALVRTWPAALLIASGIVLAALLGVMASLAWVGAALVVVGFALLLVRITLPTHTPQGFSLFTQARLFDQRLSKVPDKADVLKLLPYALARKNTRSWRSINLSVSDLSAGWYVNARARNAAEFIKGLEAFCTNIGALVHEPVSE